MAPPPNDDASNAREGASPLDALTPARKPVERVALERVEGMASSQGRAAAAYATAEPVAPPRPLRAADPPAAEPAVIVEDLHTQPMIVAPLGPPSASSAHVPPAPSSSGGFPQAAPTPQAPRARRSHTVIVDRAAFARRRGTRDKVLAFVVMAAVVGALGVLVLVLRGGRERPVPIAGAARDARSAAAPSVPVVAAAPEAPPAAAPVASAQSGVAQIAIAPPAPSAPPHPPASPPPASATPRRPAKAAARPASPAPHDVDELKSTIQK